MAITIQCPNPQCLQIVNVDSSIAGRNVKCKKCGTPFRATPTMDGLSRDTSQTFQSNDTGLFISFPTEFGRYRLLQLLGKGGMGAVYLAMDSQLNRKVALKIPFFNAKEEPKRAERFIREARSAASLHHPNICTVFDVGDVNGRPFITMAFIVGTPLEDLFQEDCLLPVATAVDIIRKMALALQKAHDLSIVHRDLKPANVMITPDGEPVIMDFGLAKIVGETDAAEARLTQEGAILGTPRYMAPEQVNGDQKAIGPATDVYALGVMLFEMLTGKAPYSGPLLQMLSQIASAPVPEVRHLRTDIEESLSNVCRKAMAKLPGERFTTMTELSEALLRVASGTAASLNALPGAALSPISPMTVTGSRNTKASGSSASGPRKSTDHTSDGSTRRSAASRTGVNIVSRPAARQVAPSLSLRERTTAKIRYMLADGSRIVILICGMAGIVMLSMVTMIFIGKKRDSSTIETEVVTFAAAGEANSIDGVLGTPATAVPGQALASSQDGAVSEKQIGQWHGWPVNAPKPAVAPFDAAQAKRHQEEWAAYLKVPVEYENSIGMKFRLIPPGEFMMGSTPAEIEEALKFVGEDKSWQNCVKSEVPPHKVILTQPVYLGVTEVTQGEYEKVMGVNPSHFATTGAGKDAVTGMETTNHPVEKMSWYDAADFCAKLSNREQHKPYYFRNGETVTPLNGTGYRLPSEAEWEYTCRAGTYTKYWFGDKDEDLVGAGWFGTNSGSRTHAAGELKANPYGLFDMHGNVWEFVEDWHSPTYYREFHEKPAINPTGPFTAGSQHVVRGGHWSNNASMCRSAIRPANEPVSAGRDIGFRASLPVDAVRQALKVTGPAMPKVVVTTLASPATTNPGWHGWHADAPVPAIAPFNAEQAKLHQEAWAKYLNIDVEYTNSIGMKFVLIPPGTYRRGSASSEIEDAISATSGENMWTVIRSEGPQHPVTLTQPFYLAAYETTQGEFQQIMNKNPSYFSSGGGGAGSLVGSATDRFPVDTVSLLDAVEFCEKLNLKEQLQSFYRRQDNQLIDVLDGTGYRLPTEAEWEFACRSGAVTRFYMGDMEEDLRLTDWYSQNSGGRPHRVGELQGNAFGVYDMQGNLAESCTDGGDNQAYLPYEQSEAINPTVFRTAAGTCTRRGGDFTGSAVTSRAAWRNNDFPAGKSWMTGFRIVLCIEGVQRIRQMNGRQ